MESQAQECSVGVGRAYKALDPAPGAQGRELARRPAAASSTMISPGSLHYLLLLPLATCFPLLAREGPVDDVGGIGGETSWAGLAGGHHSPWRSSPWGSPRWRHRLLPQALPAAEPRAAGAERAGGRLRAGRQDHGGSEAAGVPHAGGEKASGPLGSLAEELTSYSRKKGGFSFRFGRR